jgi:hypothetical protein
MVQATQSPRANKVPQPQTRHAAAHLALSGAAGRHDGGSDRPSRRFGVSATRTRRNALVLGGSSPRIPDEQPGTHGLSLSWRVQLDACLLPSGLPLSFRDRKEMSLSHITRGCCLTSFSAAVLLVVVARLIFRLVFPKPFDTGTRVVLLLVLFEEFVDACKGHLVCLAFRVDEPGAQLFIGQPRIGADPVRLFLARMLSQGFFLRSAMWESSCFSVQVAKSQG